MRVYFQRYGRQFAERGGSSMWWLAMIPGLLLTLMALAILIWPELLAYMIASAMLFGGITLLGWGWTMRRLSRRSRSDNVIYHYSGEQDQHLFG